MKSKKIRGFIGAIFALSMALSVGLTLARAKQDNRPEIVLAEGEEEQTGEQEQSQEQSETSTGSEEAKPQTQETTSKTTSESDGAAPIDFFHAIVQAFKDAWADLMAHVKRWFKLK